MFNPRQRPLDNLCLRPRFVVHPFLRRTVLTSLLYLQLYKNSAGRVCSLSRPSSQVTCPGMHPWLVWEHSGSRPRPSCLLRRQATRIYSSSIVRPPPFLHQPSSHQIREWKFLRTPSRSSTPSYPVLCSSDVLPLRYGWGSGCRRSVHPVSRSRSTCLVTYCWSLPRSSRPSAGLRCTAICRTGCVAFTDYYIPSLGSSDVCINDPSDCFLRRHMQSLASIYP